MRLPFAWLLLTNAVEVAVEEIDGGSLVEAETRPWMTDPNGTRPTEYAITPRPTASPTIAPTIPTYFPTTSPTSTAPTTSPTTPTPAPTYNYPFYTSMIPTPSPTFGPTRNPTPVPTTAPTGSPTPWLYNTPPPSGSPTSSPTPWWYPTREPTRSPTASTTTTTTTEAPEEEVWDNGFIIGPEGTCVVKGVDFTVNNRRDCEQAAIAARMTFYDTFTNCNIACAPCMMYLEADNNLHDGIYYADCHEYGVATCDQPNVYWAATQPNLFVPMCYADIQNSRPDTTRDDQYLMTRGSCEGARTTLEGEKWELVYTNATCYQVYLDCLTNGCTGYELDANGTYTGNGTLEYMFLGRRSWSWFKALHQPNSADEYLIWRHYQYTQWAQADNGCYSINVPCSYNPAMTLFTFYAWNVYCEDGRENTAWDPDCYPDGAACWGENLCACIAYTPFISHGKPEDSNYPEILAKAVGDPHILRLDGTKFDLLSRGHYDLLRFPPEKALALLVDTRVDRITRDEDGFYMTLIGMKGTLLRGYEVQFTARPFGVRILGTSATGESSQLEIGDFHAFKSLEANKVYNIDEAMDLEANVCQDEDDTSCWGAPHEGEPIKQMKLSIDGFKFIVKFIKVRALDFSVEVTNGETNIGGELGYDIKQKPVQEGAKEIMQTLM